MMSTGQKIIAEVSNCERNPFKMQLFTWHIQYNE